MLNVRLLRAWPNYLAVPAILLIWVVAGVLAAELLGAKPYTDKG
jgi:hypothetical protein